MILKNCLLPRFLSLSKNLNKINIKFSTNKSPQPTTTQHESTLQTDNKISSIPSLKQFINQNNEHKVTQGSPIDEIQNHETFVKSYEALYSSKNEQQQAVVTEKFVPLKYHIQTYGCQMNVNDSQIIRSILSKSTQLFNPDETSTPEEANVVFLNTCAIRESAEQKIFTRIRQLRANKSIKILGLLGCMAERLRDKMFAQGVNIICGPDTYRDLPKLIEISLEQNGVKNQMNIQLSVEQTYADITPVRKNISKISAFLSIMRGCNNMCSFCIVPFVRGRQRSRNVDTILKEIEIIQNDGVKQVTFLGQNVNSYHDISTNDGTTGGHQNSQGFSETFKLRNNPGVRFAQLLEISAKAFPDMRFRFTSPHPKDFPDEVLETIANYHNVCKYIHLPAQSGNTEMLFKMRRNHTRQAYLNLVQKMKTMIPTLTLSTDLICGFCGQTQQQFQDSISLIQNVKYENAFLFMYSMREKTHAHRNYVDDVPLQVKKQRLKRLIDTFTQVQRPLNQKQINQNHLLLIENTSKKDQNKWIGKTDNFKKAVVEKGKIPYFKNGQFVGEKEIGLGDYVAVKVESAGARSLGCKPIAIVEKLSDYSKFQSKILSFNNNKKVQSVV